MFKPSYTTTAATKENFVLTEEQEDIVTTARTGANLAIAAFAGASKTTTCNLIAAAVPTTSLYIAFNKSIAEEASTKFPSYVDCRTVHSLAYRKIVTPKMRAKVQNFWQMSDLDKFVPAGLQLEQQIMSFKYGLTQAVTAFCQSSEDEIKIHFYNNLPDEQTEKELVINAAILSKISAFWEEAILASSNIKITPDVYLKLFQLSRPILPYDVIYLDECLTAEQLVKTSNGVVSIQSLYNSFIGSRYSKKELPEILSFNLETQEYEYKPMLSAIKSENRDCFLVETEGLNKIEGTGNHPILTQRGYVKIEDIIIGQDYLILDSSDNQKSKLLLNDDQYQLVLGSFLGDGNLSKQSKFNTYRLRLAQGDAQLAYLKMKAKILNAEKITKGVSGYTGKNTINYVQTKTFILDKPIWDSLKDMDARALAIWYMDDGSLNNSNNVSLHSNAFTYKEHLYLQEILKTNFNLDAVISSNKGYYYFLFNKENGTKLLTLIADYVHTDLLHKTTIKGKEYSWNSKFKNYGGNYIKSITSTGKHTVYDIEVKDNHNFITTRTRNMNSVGCIVHNCQDSNEVTLELFLSQQEHGKQLIAVGDKYQSIYAWRGATNGFEIIEKTYGFVHKTLSTSFRFTQDIADRAFWITEAFLNNDIKIKGLATPVETESFCDKAIIVRNNSTLLEQLLIAEKEQQKVYVIADLSDLWSKLYHIDSLYYEKHIQYPNKELKYYPTYAALKAAADHSTELQKLLKATTKLSIGGLHNNITRIKSIIVGNKEEAEFTLSTGHKCKGLEFEEVTLTPDLLPEKLKTDDKEETEAEYRKRLLEGQTFQLLYVAVTRAKYKLHLPENIVNYIFQGYFNGEQV